MRIEILKSAKGNEQKQKKPAIYVSVNSKPDHPPRVKPLGNFFDGRIPTPPGQERVQNLTPRAYKNDPTPGAFSSIIHNKNMKK